MNQAHVHLILNHIPVIGMVIGFLLLAVAMAKRSTELKKVSLKIFVIMALIAIPTYMTGEPAEEIVEHLPGVSGSIIEQHEDAALIATVAIVVLGAFALGGLFLFRRSHTIPSWFTATVLILSIVVASMMGWTANLGGQIRHTETRADFQPSPSTDQPPETEEHENH
jgi:uncharacterized membrane protein